MDKSGLQTGIWLIGIGVLALTNFWWPGIMFVIGLSSLANGSIQGAIWLFGIGVIAWLDFWWPGMLFLVGISFIADAVLPDSKKQFHSDEFEEARDAASTPEDPSRFPNPTIITDPPLAAVPDAGDSRSWLPTRCPACGAPLTAREAIWHDNDHAECSYCHSQVSR